MLHKLQQKLQAQRQNEAQEVKNGDTCIVFEYPLRDNDINIATIKISGRYPETGFAVNKKCKEVVYVEGGEVNLTVENKTVALKKGDTALIEPNERFCWEGNATLFMPCTPAWTPEQYKMVE